MPHCGPQTAFNPQSRMALACLLVLAAGLRIWIANFQPNIVWPDEIYQVVEPAHRLVYGTGLTAWEYVVGMRSWLFPGMVAGVLWLGHLFGSAPAFKLIPVQLFMVLCSLIPVAVAWRWGERLDGVRGGVIVGGFVAVWFDLIYFAAHPLSDVIAGDIFMAALYAALPLTTAPSARRMLVAGALFGLTFVLRMQLGPALLVAAIFACGRDLRSWGAMMLGGSGVLLAAASLDWITLGTPLQSIWLNFWLNVVKGVSHEFGIVTSFFFVGLPLVSWGVIASVIVVSQLIIAGRRFPALLAVVVTIFAVQSLFLHKEWRFVFPALPPLITLCGIAAVQELSDLRRFLAERRSRAIPLTAMVLGVWSLMSLSAAMGSIHVQEWTRRRELIQAFDLAAHQPGLCGLNLVGVPWPATPGSAALPGKTPIYLDLSVDNPRATAAYNAAVSNILVSLPAPSYRRVNCFHGTQNDNERSYASACVWVRDGGCTSGSAKTPRPNWPRYFLNRDGTLRLDRVQMYQQRHS